jgi:hypothetical protein
MMPANTINNGVTNMPNSLTVTATATGWKLMRIKLIAVALVVSALSACAPPCEYGDDACYEAAQARSNALLGLSSTLLAPRPMVSCVRIGMFVQCQ